MEQFMQLGASSFVLGRNEDKYAATSCHMRLWDYK